MRSISKASVVAAATAALISLVAPAAGAHQHRPVGAWETTVGWFEEPAYAGFRNAVQFIIEKPAAGHSDGHDHSDEAASTPVENAKLKVQVIFGGEDGTEKTEPMDLTPAFGSPGEYRAFLIPTRPGTYTFHITGTVGGKTFDEYYTSGEAGANDRSEGTYNDMREPTEVQFPQKDPSVADLNEQVLAAAASADSADGTAGTAMILAIIGLVVGVAGVGFGVTGRRRSAG